MFGAPRGLLALGGTGFFVVWLLYATGGAMYLYSVAQIFLVSQKMERGIREVEAMGRANPGFAPGLAVEGAGERNERKPGFVALSYFDKLHESRSITVQTQVRMDDLLEPGETLPEPALLDAFTQARAARVADAECRLVERTLASRCVVRSSDGSAEKEGFARISITLGFVQKAPFGSLPDAGRAAYVETNETVGGDRPRPISLSAAAEARAQAYAEAADLCDRLRAAEGNCALTHVMVATDRSRYGGANGEITARATLSALTSLSSEASAG